MKSIKIFSVIIISMLLGSWTFVNPPQKTGKQGKTGIFTTLSDIGKPGFAGTAKYDEAAKNYLLSGSGVNIWGTEDSFSFLWKELKGDFILKGSVKFIGEGKYHRKIGLMVRSSLEPASATVCCAIHGDGLTSLQYRVATSGEMTEKKFLMNGTEVKLTLEKKGNLYKMTAVLPDGTTEQQDIELKLGETVKAGLFICSHNNEKSEQAVFSGVEISTGKK